jgi:hypothetical protein
MDGSHRAKDRIEIPRGGGRKPALPHRGGEYHHFAAMKPEPLPADPEPERARLERLARSLGRNYVGPARSAEVENRPMGREPGVPAGYTYLFQLAAHDLAHTSLPPSALASAPARPRNLRREGLALETIFGGGPGACPHAWDRRGDAPPTLRLGNTRNGKAWDGPQRDIGRAHFEPGGGPQSAPPDDVMICDARNDDNVILTQMTALFHEFHNRVVGFVPAGGQAGVPALAAAVVARSFRRVIAGDLLGRILDRRVHRACSRGSRFIDRPREEGSLPVEFAFAAGRLGHAMVRQGYRLNDGTSATLEGLIAASAGAFPRRLPLRADWIVKWSLFFDVDEATTASPAFNWALRFGPRFASDLLLPLAATRPDGAGPDGIVYRDLIRAAASRLPGAKALARAIDTDRTRPAVREACATLLGRKSRRTLMRDGFEALAAEADGFGSSGLTGADRSTFEDDPPLLLYFLFEALIEGRDGRRLGPAASVVIAEAMRRAFADPDAPAIGEPASERVAEAELAVFSGSPPATMPDILNFLRANASPFGA